MVRMKRIAGVASLALALAACSGGNAVTGETFERYYDPGGLFSAEFPASNEITIIPPDSAGPTGAGPRIVTGAISGPPQPQQTGGGGLFDFGQIRRPGGNLYLVYVLDAGDITSPDDLSAALLTGAPGSDVKVKERTTLGGREGVLVVADLLGEGRTVEVASAFTVLNGTGYMVASGFSPGDWPQHREEFLRVVGSLQTEVPAGIGILPQGSPTA